MEAAREASAGKRRGWTARMRQRREERAEREAETESHLASRDEVWREESEVWR